MRIGGGNLNPEDRQGIGDLDRAAVHESSALVRQMKQEGVNLAICLYAAKALDIDPAAMLSEVDHVGNGFVSVAGYEAQGTCFWRALWRKLSETRLTSTTVEAIVRIVSLKISPGTVTRRSVAHQLQFPSGVSPVTMSGEIIMP